MKESAHQYFASFHICVSKTQVQDEQGAAVGLDVALNQVTQSVLNTQPNKGKVIFIGNGGSASIASHQAVDLWKNGGVRAIAFNDASLLTCVSNDYGYEHVFEKPVEMFADKDDVLIAISSSGCSPNILRAVDMAKQKGCQVVTMSGFKSENPLRRKGQLNFYVSSDSYGFVELSHLTLCHYVADQVMAHKNVVVTI